MPKRWFISSFKSCNCNLYTLLEKQNHQVLFFFINCSFPWYQVVLTLVNISMKAETSSEIDSEISRKFTIITINFASLAIHAYISREIFMIITIEFPYFKHLISSASWQKGPTTSHLYTQLYPFASKLTIYTTKASGINTS